MQIDEIISNYFRLTGRPISTMTVEEYLTFLKQGNVSVQAGSIRQDISQAVPVLPVKEDNIQKQITDKPTAISNFDQANDAYEEKKSVLKQKDVLTLLRSVKG